MKNKSLFNYLTYKIKHRWRSVDTHFQNGAGSLSHSLLLWNTANTSFMTLCIQLPPRLPKMQHQKSLTGHWLTCSGWGREPVSLVFSYKGDWSNQKEQWHTKVNILQLAIGYLNATTYRKTWNTEPEIATDRSILAPQRPMVDQYGSGFGPPRLSGSCFAPHAYSPGTVLGMLARLVPTPNKPLTNKPVPSH